MNRAEEILSLIEGGKEIAKTILQQLGGSKFVAMTGAKNLGFTDTGLSFQIGRNAGKVSHVAINLDVGKDLYDMFFYNIRGAKMKTIKEYKGVSFDQLQKLFIEVTGMYTSL